MIRPGQTRRFTLLAGWLVAMATLAAGQPRPAESPGASRSPFDDETWLVIASDGTRFAAHEARRVAEHASVPDLVVLPDGRWIIYYVDFSEFEADHLEKISAHVSTDSGRTWRKQRVSIDGLTGPKAVDPDAVQLEDGRVRLYYFSMPLPTPGGPGRNEPPHHIRSAVSPDGLKFKEEPGIRFTKAGITDPDVIRLPTGAWRMYCARPEARGRSGLVFAQSADGLDFIEDTTAFIGVDGIPGSVVLPNGRTRLYLNDRHGGIAAYISSDGREFNFERIALDGMGIADPSPARLPDGRYALVYKKLPAPTQRPPESNWQSMPSAPPPGGSPPLNPPPPGGPAPGDPWPPPPR